MELVEVVWTSRCRGVVSDELVSVLECVLT